MDKRRKVTANTHYVVNDGNPLLGYTEVFSSEPCSRCQNVGPDREVEKCYYRAGIIICIYCFVDELFNL